MSLIILYISMFAFFCCSLLYRQLRLWKLENTYCMISSVFLYCDWLYDCSLSLFLPYLLSQQLSLNISWQVSSALSGSVIQFLACFLYLLLLDLIVYSLSVWSCTRTNGTSIKRWFKNKTKVHPYSLCFFTRVNVSDTVLNSWDRVLLCNPS